MNLIYRAKKDKEHPYVMVLRETLYDKNLSLKAKGLLCFILSKTEDWHINVRGLAKELKESKNALAGTINELIEHGYCVRGQRERTKQGYYLGYDYFIFECPEEKERWSKKSKDKQNAP